MSDNTGIEWTDATYNPVTGCTEVSPGCDSCYAKTFAERWRGTPGHYFENGFDVQLRPDKLTLPFSWKKPRRVFVNSMSDLFHKDVPDDYIAQVFAVMALTPRHTYQVLTKRHGRMRALLNSQEFVRLIDDHREQTKPGCGDFQWPLRNVWMGVSVENQKWADIRVPALANTPAAVRFLSCEPLLGPVDVSDWLGTDIDEPGIDWVIAGGESGRKARPMAPQWATGLRDQCVEADVPFFFKQWGEWAPTGYLVIGGTSKGTLLAGDPVDDMGHRVELGRIGKKAAGRELDGRTWDQFPVAP